MYMKTRFLLPVAALLTFNLIAHADTFELFDLNATLTNGGTLTGTIDLDLDTTRSSPNVFDSSADVTYTLDGVSTTYSGNDNGLGWNLSAPYITSLGYGNPDVDN